MSVGLHVWFMARPMSKHYKDQGMGEGAPEVVYKWDFGGLLCVPTAEKGGSEASRELQFF